jgi:hypothetical protein
MNLTFIGRFSVSFIRSVVKNCSSGISTAVYRSMPVFLSVQNRKLLVLWSLSSANASGDGNFISVFTYQNSINPFPDCLFQSWHWNFRIGGSAVWFSCVLLVWDSGQLRVEGQKKFCGGMKRLCRQIAVPSCTYT